MASWPVGRTGRRPDVDAATRVTLVLTHVAAAAVIIPGLNSRLR
ncbi:DUF6069 family protein [Streptomyces lushanensis]